MRTRSGRIYLTGFMASGKSTIGPILANTIGYTALDLDRLIESRTGQSITALFHSLGEEEFRRIERETLREICTADRCVISLGGGTIVQPDNLALILETGIVVYLKSGTEQLLRRLRHKTDRPMLHDAQGDLLSEEGLRNKIESLLASRSDSYGKADLVIDTDGISVGRTVDTIMRRLAPFITQE